MGESGVEGTESTRSTAEADRRDIFVTVGVTAFVWLTLSSTPLLLPVRLLVTLVHEAGHALVAARVGADVSSVTVNSDGGGLTMAAFDSEPSTWRVVSIASAGYLGAALVGAAMMALAGRLRSGRVALAVLAVLVAAVGLAWVPWNYEPAGPVARAAGASSGDGRLTTFVCIAAVVVLVALAVVASARVGKLVVLALATALCLGSIDDLRDVLDISSVGGVSDAAVAAEVTPLSSWLWALIWLLVGVSLCGAALWSALSRDPRPAPTTPSAGDKPNTG